MAVGDLRQRRMRRPILPVGELRMQGGRDLREGIEQPCIEVAVTALLQNIYRFIIAKRFLVGTA
jgi:hypothetical protein